MSTTNPIKNAVEQTGFSWKKKQEKRGNSEAELLP